MDSEHRHDFLLGPEMSDSNDPASGSSIKGLAPDCTACAALAADIESIRLATIALPAPQRTRDYRLDAATAARLRRRRFSFPDWLFRPLAPGLVAAGLALLLLSPGAALPAAVGPSLNAPMVLAPNPMVPQANTSIAGASDSLAVSTPSSEAAPIFGAAGVIEAPSASPEASASPTFLRSGLSSPEAVTVEPMAGSYQPLDAHTDQLAMEKSSDRGAGWQFDLRLAGLILIGLGLTLLARNLRVRRRLL
jgi:hypothetical protein